MTIFEAYNSTKQKLEKAGIEDYVFEAKQIIKHITGLSAPQIINNYNKELSLFQQNNLVALLHQREVRYPLQYIFGEWDFYLLLLTSSLLLKSGTRKRSQRRRAAGAGKGAVHRPASAQAALSKDPGRCAADQGRGQGDPAGAQGSAQGAAQPGH